MKKPKETELSRQKAELEHFSKVCEEKESGLEELKRRIEQFQYQYSSEVAQKQTELNLLNAQLAEVIQKHTSFAYDLKKTRSGINTSPDRLAAGYVDVKTDSKVKLYDVQESKEVKKVYRKIASIIHPDKATEFSSRAFRTKLMTELNEAYARKDIIKMQHIIDQWMESPEAVTGEDSSAELLRTNRALALIKKRILTIETEVSRIIASDIYVMMMKVHEAEKAGRDILAEMSIAINAKIKNTQNQIFIRTYG